MAATLADITCDSDGKLDRFCSAREGVDCDPVLPLHELVLGEKYYLAMFLTGGCCSPRYCDLKAWVPAAGSLQSVGSKYDPQAYHIFTQAIYRLLPKLVTLLC